MIHQIIKAATDVAEYTFVVYDWYTTCTVVEGGTVVDRFDSVAIPTGDDLQVGKGFTIAAFGEPHVDVIEPLVSVDFNANDMSLAY